MIKPAYSVSFLLSINIFVWQNVLYFLDAPRITTDASGKAVAAVLMQINRDSGTCIVSTYLTHAQPHTAAIFGLQSKSSWLLFLPWKSPEFTCMGAR